MKLEPNPDFKTPKPPPNVLIVREAARILAAQNDINACISYCFLDMKPQQRFHAEWQEFYDNNDRGVLWAPVEHGKSEQIAAWRTVYELGRNPELRFWLLYPSLPLGTKMVTEIEEIILTNERLHRVFPHLVPEDRKGHKQSWNTKDFIVRRDSNERDPSVQTSGLIGSVLGARIDRLIGDDLPTFKNTFYVTQRERCISWFQGSECMGRITGDGKVFLINTPWHEKDLPHTAVKQLGFEQKKYRACNEFLGDILWPIERKGKSVFGFDTERLEQKRKNMGPIEFARCFLCETLSDETEWFRFESMKDNIVPGLRLNDPLPDGFVPLVAVDPAVSKKRATAKTAFFVGGYHPVSGMKRMSYIHSERMEAVQIVRELLRLYRAYGYKVRMVVESNAQQGYLLQILETREFMQGLQAAEAEINGLKGAIIPFVTGEKKHDVDSGIPAMSADFEARTWQIPESNETDNWFRQALAYRPGGSVHTGDVMMAAYLFYSEASRMSIRRIMFPPSVSNMIDRGKKDGSGRAEMAGLMSKQF